MYHTAGSAPFYPHGSGFPPSGSLGAFRWVHCQAHGAFPHDAVLGGTDRDGSPIFVGRAHHERDLIPAKVIPTKRVAYVCFNGREYPKYQFEVLCETRLSWVHSSNGMVPHNAISAGNTRNGETLYIGRVFSRNACTVGKIHPSHRCCYIPYNGKEERYTAYEVLVRN